MYQDIINTLNGYRQTLEVVARLLMSGQMALRKLAVVPVNLGAGLINRPPPFMPPVLQLDITDRCNLQCPGCLTGMGYNRSGQGMMPFTTFQSLIDETAPSTAVVVLYNSGEPLLHPDAPRMIRHLTRHRIASIISTNGHFINTREKAEELVKAGLSVMVVSLSGATQKTYELYHRGGRLEQVLNGVRYITEARARLKTKTPLVIFRFLIMDHNLHETAAMKSMAKSAGCDWHEFRKVNWRACVVEPPPESVPDALMLPGRAKNRHCLWPWLISVVNRDGKAYPCCFYRLDLPCMGDATAEGGLRAVWKNNAYNRFRVKMRTGIDRPAACRDCPAETGFQTRFSSRKRTVYLYSKNRENGNF